MLRVPAEWRKQVEELVVALKALSAAQASLMSREMFDLLCPRHFRRSPRALANEKGKEEMFANTESTDSDSYSAY
jgi:hypothetical protein